MDEIMADDNSTSQESLCPVGSHPPTGPAAQQALAETANDPLDESLENALTCGICQDIMVDVNVVMLCGHLFCGFCISKWFAVDPTGRCPACRKRAVLARYHPHLDQIARAYVEKHPESRLSEVEVAERRKHYRPSSEVILRPSADVQVAQMDTDSETEDDEDLEESQTPPAPVNLSCPCCDPDSPYEYVCPEPMPGTVMHRQCSRCTRVFPLHWKPYQCENCGLCTCATMFECTALQPEFGSERFELTRLRDSRMRVGQEPAIYTHPRARFSYNAFEKRSMSNWMMWKSYTWSDIREMVRRWAIDTNSPDMNKLVCSVCSAEKFESLLLKWWLYYKESPESGYFDPRPKCWYGIDCRTQGHRPEHARRFNHLCRQLPAEQRTDTVPVDIPYFHGGLAFPGQVENNDAGN